jgi:hypothetical protein
VRICARKNAQKKNVSGVVDELLLLYIECQKG